ncbi:MAG: M67 family metallopeptidase [Chloroflexi bacterium]|nr:M67 family metallopeptidase [Chloroflexota bacterium]
MHKQVIRIPQTILDDMIAHAKEGKPEEVCGILSGQGNVVTRAYRAQNVAEKPVVTYNFSPQDQYRIFKDIDEREEEMMAIYHSHPASPAYPSVTDLRLAFYPEASYIILSLARPEQPVVRAFRLEDGNIQEITVEPVTTQPGE